jgi:hypothetical protein
MPSHGPFDFKGGENEIDIQRRRNIKYCFLSSIQLLPSSLFFSIKNNRGEREERKKEKRKGRKPQIDWKAHNFGHDLICCFASPLHIILLRCISFNK